MMNVLERFKYCPVCGSSHFETNSEKSKLCRSCGFEYFINPSAATAAFIMNERGELLVERRKREPAKGMLDLPGGFCDVDENIVQGLRREVREETGLKVVSERFVMSCPNVYLYSGVEIPTMDLFFECEVTARSLLLWTTRPNVCGFRCVRFVSNSSVCVPCARLCMSLLNRKVKIDENSALSVNGLILKNRRWKHISK